MKDVRSMSLAGGAGVAVLAAGFFLKIQGLALITHVSLDRMPFIAFPFVLLTGLMGGMIGLIAAGVFYAVGTLIQR